MKKKAQQIRKRAILILWKKYMTYICVPLFMILLLVVYLTQLLRQQVLTQNDAVINQAIAALDANFEAIHSVAAQIAVHSDIKTLCGMHNTGTPRFYYQIRQARKTLSQYGNMLMNADVFLYCDRNNVCTSANGLCTDSQKYYGKLFQMGGFSWEEFEAYLQRPAPVHSFPDVSGITLEDARYEGVVYQYRYTNGAAKAALFFVLNGDYLNQLFQVSTQNGTTVYILDQKQTILFSARDSALSASETAGENAQEVVEQTLVETETGLDYSGLQADNLVMFSQLRSGLQILCVTPKKSITRGITGIECLLALFGIAAVILALSIAFLMARRNSALLEHIFSSKYDTSDISWKDIYSGILQVLFRYERDNFQLEDSIAKTRLQLQTNFFVKLLLKNFQRTYDMEIYAKDAQINIRADRYHYTLFSVDSQKAEPGYGDLERVYHVNRMLAEAVSRELKDGSLAVCLHVDRLAVLRYDNGEPAEPPEMWCARIREKMEAWIQEPDVGLSVCMVSDFAEVYLLPMVSSCCFSLLNRAALSGEFSGEPILLDLNAKMPIEEKAIQSERWEQDMYAAIRTGDTDAALKAFEALFASVAVMEYTTERRPEDFIRKMQNILLLSSADTDLQPDDDACYLGGMSMGLTLHRYYAAQIRALCGACKKMIQEHAEPNRAREFRDNVARFVDQDVANPELSLTLAAQKFGFSPTYFSALFKENIGKNFSVYVEERRMELARRLLLSDSSSSSVSDVAQACGYLNPNTFSRGYKKYFGVTPSQTREAWLNGSWADIVHSDTFGENPEK